MTPRSRSSGSWWATTTARNRKPARLAGETPADFRPTELHKRLTRGILPMHELNQTAHVRYRTDTLIAEAAAARLAHQHRDNGAHAVLQPLVADSRHEPARARRA